MSKSTFWSRRKAAVEAEEHAELRVREAEILQAREAEQADKSDEDLLEELGLPDPEGLSKGDDFKIFLQETVPARIRARALRRLWLTNPILANVDGLVDYGEDFTDANCVIEGMQTAYQVGKGMTKHVLELARQVEEEADAEQVDAQDNTPVEEGEEAVAFESLEDPSAVFTDDVEPPLVGSTPFEQDALAKAPTAEEDGAFIPTRRMRFAFADGKAEI